MSKIKTCTILTVFFFVLSCSSFFPAQGNPFSKTATTISNNAQQATSELSALSWIGGLATLAGIVAIVITRGTFGARAIVLGVGLIILNFAIANYLAWILIPSLIGTGGISLTWSYLTIRKLIKNKKEFCKC